MALLRKSGVAGRVVDMRIDQAAKASADAVRSAGNAGATERFLGRFLDHLHDLGNQRIEHAARDDSEARAATRRRRRRQAD